MQNGRYCTKISSVVEAALAIAGLKPDQVSKTEHLKWFRDGCLKNG